MNNITKIGEAILAVLSAWNPVSTVVDNVMNVINALAAGAGGSHLLGGALLQDALKAEASIKALEAGDVAILGVIDVGDKHYAIFGIDNSSLLAGKLFGTGAQPVSG